MRLVEIIKSFGKFRRKRSTEKEVDKLADYQRNTSEAEDGRRGHENPALDVTITDGSSSSSAESSRSGSLDFSAVQLEQSTEDHLDHLEEEEDADDDRSSVSKSPLVSAWRRLKRVRAVGILCALASVLFWSFNGLLIKLNDGYFGVHVLESLTISSFIVCLVYLTFIFSVYGRRPANSGGLSSTSSVTSFASSTLSTSSSKKDIFVGGVSKGGHHHPHNHHLSTMTIDWRVILGVPGERWSLFLRCFLGTISLATFYTSYTYIPLSDATTIRFTSPVFIAAFAHFLVAEPFGLLQVVNSCTTLAGVVLIGRPSFLFGGPSSSGDNSTFFDTNSTTTTSPTFFHFYAQFGGSEESGAQGGNSNSNSIGGGGGRTHTAIGLALALISAVSISVSMIAMRRMKRTPAALVIFWFSACNVLLGLLGLAALGKWSVPPGVTSWAIIGSTSK
ncbi:hypothetical protein TYRP_021779 [Tyrophagus putrescentiae]|nr:hypothetical protein TYRP_021779 [Tyrophagus putrescentiae]